MNEEYKELHTELKKLQSAFINIGFIMEDIAEKKGLDIEDMEYYPFEESFETITADVADWMEEIVERIEEME